MITAEAIAARALRVLLVEDDDSDAWLFHRRLSEVGKGHYDITRAVNIEKAMSALHTEQLDVALLDMSLPGLSGIDALLHLQDTSPTLPIVILTSLDDEKLALQAVKQGAQDYLIKGEGDGHLFKRAIRYAIERKHFEKNLIRLANYDTLTGLINRPFFENRLGLALARARRGNFYVSVLFLDLNGFKQVNDSFGHEMGDHVLKEVAKRLESAFREYDTIARFGGDEFAVLLEGIVSPEDCVVAAEKIISVLSKPVVIEDKKILIGCGIGIATASSKERLPPALLIKYADTAMYCAKQSTAGSFYRVYDESMSQISKASA